MDLSCVELCIKSNFSFLNGGSHPEEYARRAVDFGLEAFAITDHNSVSGIVRAHTEIKKINAKNSKNNNILNTRLIPGTEINTVEGLVITALAKNQKGWANICRLLTQGKTNGKKGSCKITIDGILQYGKHISLPN